MIPRRPRAAASPRVVAAAAALAVAAGACVLYVALVAAYDAAGPRRMDGGFALARVPLGCGRTGNRMLQMALMYMLAAEHQRPFVNPYAHSAGCAALGCPRSRLTPPPPPPRAMNLSDGRPVTPATFDLRLFLPQLDYLRAEVFAPDPRPPPSDLLVHVRLDDIFDSPAHYTLAPRSYYRAAAAAAARRLLAEGGGGDFLTVVILGRPGDDAQREILHAVAEAVVGVVESDFLAVVDADDGIDEVYRRILGARAVVAGISTFAIAPTLLSARVRDLYLPHFAPNDDLALPEAVSAASLARPRLHVLPLPFAHKITADDWRARLHTAVWGRSIAMGNAETAAAAAASEARRGELELIKLQRRHDSDARALDAQIMRAVEGNDAARARGLLAQKRAHARAGRGLQQGVTNLVRAETAASAAHAAAVQTRVLERTARAMDRNSRKSERTAAAARDFQGALARQELTAEVLTEVFEDDVADEEGLTDAQAVQRDLEELSALVGARRAGELMAAPTGAVELSPAERREFEADVARLAAGSRDAA